MEPQDSQSTKDKKPPKSYGKRPIWQWAVIYLIAAVVVYGLVYLLFMKDNAGSGY